MINSNIVQLVLGIFIAHRKKEDILNNIFRLTIARLDVKKGSIRTSILRITVLLVSNLNAVIALLIASIREVLIRLWKVGNLLPFSKIPFIKKLARLRTKLQQ